MESLDGYFLSFSAAELDAIRAIAMDMWPPYISSTLRHVPRGDETLARSRYLWRYAQERLPLKHQERFAALRAMIKTAIFFHCGGLRLYPVTHAKAG